MKVYVAMTLSHLDFKYTGNNALIILSSAGTRSGEAIQFLFWFLLPFSVGISLYMTEFALIVLSNVNPFYHFKRTSSSR